MPRHGGAYGAAAPVASEHCLRAFGLSLLTDLRPPGAWRELQRSGPTVRLLGAGTQTIAECWSGLEEVGWEATTEGASFVAERGCAGDYRFVHGEQPAGDGSPRRGTLAVHHLSADGRVLRCAPTSPDEQSWWRTALDSVLFTVALLHGYEALHATALATSDGGAIAITAPTGGGKSTLLSELLRRGLSLMADDVLVLESRGPELAALAHPAPPLMTIPAERLSTLAIGCQPICSPPGEHWIAVPTHSQPLPLTTLVVLDRRPGSELSLTRIDDSFPPLMAALLNFPRTPDRARARLELASVLAAQTELLRLTADVSTPVEDLADALGALGRC